MLLGDPAATRVLQYLNAPLTVGSRADFEAMSRAIALHRLRPVIDRTFGFAEAKEAYRHFERRGHFGKVVIMHG